MEKDLKSTPPILPLLGLAKKRRYWKTAVKGVILYITKKNHILDSKISSGMGGAGGGQRRGGIGGDDCIF